MAHEDNPSRSERLGAHVSTQGGVHRAPARGTAIGATAMQVFTKTPNRWREPVLNPSVCDAFRDELERTRLADVVAHDSYLINLASPDRDLTDRSIRAFIAELKRCETLKIGAVVSHPGNYIESRSAGLRRNSTNLARCLAAVPGSVRVLLETTAGCGTALGSRFEELAELRQRLPPDLQERVGFCADTCHLYAAGYDLVNDYDGVWTAWDRIIGLEHLACLHLNDSRHALGSRRDRHAPIAEGTLGPEPFRRIMTDPRLAAATRILETPKGDDPVREDRRMLRRLRSYARARRVR